MIELLLKLGLSDKEARVYVAVLELGEDTAQNVAKKADVNRATTYVILQRLMHLGLVSSIVRGKKTLFIGESPTELANLLEEQRREVELRKSYLEEAMGQLKAIYNSNQKKPAVRYFEGADGLEALDRYGYEQFPEGSQMSGIIPVDIIEDRFPSRRKAAISDRVKRKIATRMIYTHKNGPMPDYVNKNELREGIFLPRELFPIDATVEIIPGWGVKFFSFQRDNYFGVLVQSPDIARNMQYIFDLAWEGASKKKKD